MALWDELPACVGTLVWAMLMSFWLLIHRSASSIRRPSLACPWSSPYFLPKSKSFRPLVAASLQRCDGSARHLPRPPARLLVPRRCRGLQFRLSISFTKTSRPVKRARVAPPPKSTAASSAQPVTPRKAPPARCRQCCHWLLLGQPHRPLPHLLRDLPLRQVRECQVCQLSVPVGHKGALRDRQLKQALPIFLATLNSGFTVLIHCVAGIHRAPILAGLLLAWIRRGLRSFGETSCDRPGRGPQPEGRR